MSGKKEGMDFSSRAQELARTSPLHKILYDPHTELSERLERSGIQEGAAVRALLLAREVADYLMTGELSEVLALLQQGIYPLGRGRHLDAQNRFHLLKMLLHLQEGGVAKRISSLTAPYDNPLADHLIRETLALNQGTTIGPQEVQRAVLVALLTPLRQNVGSCFGTAPAILIQQEQPHRLIDDLEELMNRGSLGRVIGGVEARVPLSPSWGSGDLLRPLVPTPGLALSPGLWGAFEKGGVLDPALLFREKEEVCRQLLAPFMQLPITTPEQIIKGVVPQERVQSALDTFKGLTDCALLKAWEFTLASFAEAKTSFSKWNLYASLGLHPEEKGGIGEQIQTTLQDHLERTNRELEELQVEYESAYTHAKYLEARLARASEEEAKWQRLELRRRVGTLDQLTAKRDEVHQKAQKIARLLPTLIDSYGHLFPAYFQEVYDPEIREGEAFLYEDAPAGFRLLYKHGRAAPSAWTLIEGIDPFVSALSGFFTLTEQILRDEEPYQGLEPLLSEVVGVITRHVRTDAFLESALVRMAAAHRGRLPKNPLQHLDRVEKKPWAYLSGGTMRELVAGYYGKEELPKLRERRVESEEDLLLFLLDVMKEQPSSTTDLFIRDPMRSLLIQSPTHAFLFKPGLVPFREGWIDEGNTSTWVREQVVSPAENLLATLWLDRAMVEVLAASLPPPFRSRVKIPTGRIRPRELRKEWTGRFPQLADTLDGLLYTHLPFSSASATTAQLKKIFSNDVRGVRASTPLVPASELHSLCLQVALQEEAFAPEDTPWKIRMLLAQAGCAMPIPLLFADTNWSGQLFGFVVNPGTDKLSLWRTDYLGLSGAPMGRWKSSLDGTSRHPWGVYINPREFT